MQEERFIRAAGDDFAPHYRIMHCYARNVGEIYAYYPATSFLTYADQAMELLEYTPQ